MNVPTHITRDLQFRTLRRKLGGNAMIALIYLGLTYQSARAAVLKINNKDELLMACDLEGEVEADTLWALLVGSWLIEESPNHYRFPFFEDNNLQLLTLWANAKHGHKSHGTKRNGTEQKEREKNETKPNLTKQDGIPMATHSLPIGSDTDESELLKAHGIPPSRPARPDLGPGFQYIEDDDDDNKPF